MHVVLPASGDTFKTWRLLLVTVPTFIQNAEQAGLFDLEGLLWRDKEV